MLGRIAGAFLFFQAAARAGGLVEATQPERPPLDPTWSISLQAGYANTYQLALGGAFGEGPYFQNRLTAGVSNLLKRGDNLSFFGWSTTDLPNTTANWQAGFTYKDRIFNRGRHSLSLGGGFQRWLLPSVKTGADDWLAAGTLTYATTWKHLPIKVSEDSLSHLASTLPTGSLLYTQIQTQHPLLKRDHYQLLLRHGVAHAYGWGFWGASGNRVVRYSASVALAWKDTTLELGCRQQFGLQDKIPYNRYWTFLLTRQLTRPFHAQHGP